MGNVGAHTNQLVAVLAAFLVVVLLGGLFYGIIKAETEANADACDAETPPDTSCARFWRAMPKLVLVLLIIVVLGLITAAIIVKRSS